MYIWILLATIMVALSFFNLSPRSDKEGNFNEVKAATLVNRFRIEHTTFSRVAECQLVSSNSDNEYMKFDLENEDTKNSFDDNLPIGFTTTGVGLTTYHYIFCLDDDITKGGSPKLKSCAIPASLPDGKTIQTAVYRYGVSFGEIPSRWIGKGANDTHVIIPVLGNTISKQFVRGSILGVLSCYALKHSGGEDDKCSFQGSHSYEKDQSAGGAHTGGSTHLSFQPLEGGTDDFYNVLYGLDDFRACDGSPTGCLFAIHRLSNRDVSNHCEALSSIPSTPGGEDGSGE